MLLQTLELRFGLLYLDVALLDRQAIVSRIDLNQAGLGRNEPAFLESRVYVNDGPSNLGDQLEQLSRCNGSKSIHDHFNIFGFGRQNLDQQPLINRDLTLGFGSHNHQHNRNYQSAKYDHKNPYGFKQPTFFHG